MTDVSATPWDLGDIVEYDAYGAKFRGRLTKKPVGFSDKCWVGVVTSIDSKGHNDLWVGAEAGFVEGHSKKIAHAPREFKPGDRVIWDDGGELNFAGWERMREECIPGTVVDGTDYDAHTVTVDFDGLGRKWVRADCLSLLEKTASTTPEFKVGDEVTGIWITGGKTVTGPIQEVDSADSDMTYRVDGYWLDTATVRKVEEEVSEFKPGDLVKATLSWSNQWFTGRLTDVSASEDHKLTLVDPGTFYHGNDVGLEVHMPVRRLELIRAAEPAPAARPLVGPKPAVQTPVFVAPFKADENWVMDANGDRLFRVEPDATVWGDDCKFAAYVAEALNARVSGEQ